MQSAPILVRADPSPLGTTFSTFVSIISYFFCNLFSYSFRVSTSFDPYRRIYFSILLVPGWGDWTYTLKSVVIWPQALKTVKLMRTKPANTEKKQPWISYCEPHKPNPPFSVFLLGPTAHWVKHLGCGGQWKKPPPFSRADFKGKLTFPIAFYLPSIPSAYFFFSTLPFQFFCPLLISLLTLIRLMSLITRWVFPKLPQQCFPSAADLQGNFVKLQIGDRSLMLSDTECFIVKCF